MNKKLRTLALLLICAGLLMIAGAFAANDFALPAGDGGEEMQDKSMTIEEAFSSVEIEDSSASIYVLPSEDGSCSFSYTELPGLTSTVRVERGTLKIAEKRDWTKQLFSFSGRTLILKLPQKIYDSIDIEVSSGRIDISSLQAKEIELDSSSGSIYAKALSGNEFSADSSSGSIHVEECSFEREAELESSSGSISAKALSAAQLEMESSSGDIELESIDGKKINIQSASGDVSGTFKNDMNFTIKTASGDVRAPLSTPGAAPCTIRTASGDITISINAQ